MVESSFGDFKSVGRGITKSYQTIRASIYRRRRSSRYRFVWLRINTSRHHLSPIYWRVASTAGASFDASLMACAGDLTRAQLSCFLEPAGGKVEVCSFGQPEAPSYSLSSLARSLVGIAERIDQVLLDLPTVWNMRCQLASTFNLSLELRVRGHARGPMRRQKC